MTAATPPPPRAGAPLGHDYAVLSLSDRLKPWEVVAERLRAAAAADLVLALYNPGSQQPHLAGRQGPRPAAGTPRPGHPRGGGPGRRRPRASGSRIVRLADLDPAQVDMRTPADSAPRRPGPSRAATAPRWSGPRAATRRSDDTPGASSLPGIGARPQLTLHHRPFRRGPLVPVTGLAAEVAARRANSRFGECRRPVLQSVRSVRSVERRGGGTSGQRCPVRELGDGSRHGVRGRETEQRASARLHRPGRGTRRASSEALAGRSAGAVRVLRVRAGRHREVDAAAAPGGPRPRGGPAARRSRRPVRQPGPGRFRARGRPLPGSPRHGPVRGLLRALPVAGELAVAPLPAPRRGRHPGRPGRPARAAAAVDRRSRLGRGSCT